MVVDLEFAWSLRPRKQRKVQVVSLRPNMGMAFRGRLGHRPGSAPRGRVAIPALLPALLLRQHMVRAAPSLACQHGSSNPAASFAVGTGLSSSSQSRRRQTGAGDGLEFRLLRMGREHDAIDAEGVVNRGHDSQDSHS